MLCFLCGEMISSTADGKVETCPDCSLRYCEKCAPTVSRCFVCGSKPVPMRHDHVSRVDLSELYAEVTASDQRNQPRTQVRLECAYTFIASDEEPAGGEKHRALTRDVSKSGLCIYSRTPLREGQKVSFRQCKVFQSRKTATVRWVRRTERGTFIAGLMFEGQGLAQSSVAIPKA